MMANHDWHTEVERGLDAIRDEGKDGTCFQLSLVPAHDWDEIKAKAADGDKEARASLLSILDWLDTITTANETDAVWPQCACCNSPMQRGGVAGWAIFVPKEKDKTGMVGGFCTACYHHGPEHVLKTAVANMIDKMGAHPMALH
jgi:hypothetical protein